MQYQFLKDLLLQRKIGGGSPQCYELPDDDVFFTEAVQCMGESEGDGQSNNLPVLTVEIIRVRNCSSSLSVSTVRTQVVVP